MFLGNQRGFTLKNSASPGSRHRFFPFYYGWAIVGVAFIETALSAGISNSQGVFLKPLLVEFGWTRAMVAGAFAVSNIVAAALATYFGALADKYGPRLLVALGGVFSGGAYLLVAAINNLWQFYLAFGLVMGLGRSAGWGSIGPTVSRWFVARRGLAQGIMQSGAGLGTIVFPPLATYLIITRDWRFAYIVMGLLLVVLVGSMSLIYRRQPQDMGLQPDGKAGPSPAHPAPATGKRQGPPAAKLETVDDGHTLRQALMTKSFRLLTFAAVAASFTQQLVLLHLVPHATDVGFSPAVAAIFMSVMGVSNIVGKIAMGIVSDHIGRRSSLIISFGLAAAMLLWLLAAHSMWSFYLFAAIYGFAYGSWIPMFPAIAGDLFGLGALGAIYGTVAAGNSLGGAAGTFLGGFIFDVAQSYDFAFITAATLLTVAIGALVRMRLP